MAGTPEITPLSEVGFREFGVVSNACTVVELIWLGVQILAKYLVSSAVGQSFQDISVANSTLQFRRSVPRDRACSNPFQGEVGRYAR
jgi:hypothetical protein